MSAKTTTEANDDVFYRNLTCNAPYSAESPLGKKMIEDYELFRKQDKHEECDKICTVANLIGDATLMAAFHAGYTLYVNEVRRSFHLTMKDALEACRAIRATSGEVAFKIVVQKRNHHPTISMIQ